jgi:hypothetical protein
LESKCRRFAPGSNLCNNQTTPTNIYKEHQWLRQMLLELLLIRSYYPKLTASQVKHILMDSGVVITTDDVIVGIKDIVLFYFIPIR